MTGGEVSRRELLAGIGMAGAAIGSSAVGHSTASAFLADTEQFAGNVLTAGEVDIEITSSASYNGDQLDDVAIPEIKPGDSGRFVFCPEVLGNPSYLWLCGAVTRNAENGYEESEGETINDEDAMPTDGPGGELGAAMTTELAYVLPDESGDRVPISVGSFEDVLGRLRHGVALDAEALERNEVVDPGNQVCFEGSNGPCVELAWEVPDDRNLNHIVSDELEFEFEFTAQQCRHNDGTLNPCPQGLSFVSFCVEDSTELEDSDITFSVAERNASGEPVAIRWESDVSLQTVVIYYAGVFENFYLHNDEDPKEGTATVGMGDERLHYNENSDNDPAGDNGQSPSDPCPTDQSGIKYNNDGGEFTLDS